MKIRYKLTSSGNRQPDKVATTSERLQTIMAAKHMKQADLARATGISRGAISNYVLGRYEPKSDIAQKLANALNCSDMWLSGYDVPMGKTVRSFEDEENPYELEVRDAFDTLEVADQIYVRDWIIEFVKNPIKAKNFPSKLILTEEEKLMLELFRRIPQDRQQEALELLRVALKMQQRP
jgi:transcriptional regulator with XRE-family HTH domain